MLERVGAEAAPAVGLVGLLGDHVAEVLLPEPRRRVRGEAIEREVRDGPMAVGRPREGCRGERGCRGEAEECVDQAGHEE
ncbi:MAG: hypothetical protein H7Y88_13245 [Phycisphaerales bacterium]|nr:hypothetical protein [Phycisphaerales bacterium]